jgi:hypothetical protein
MGEIDEAHQPHGDREADGNEIEHHGEREAMKGDADDGGKRFGNATTASMKFTSTASNNRS